MGNFIRQNEPIISLKIETIKIRNGKEIEHQGFVALKILNNSQHLATNFLKEVAYHKLTDGDNSIIKCHGISQDPDTKDYIMVIK